MNQMEELEYRLQKLEATVEQMKKDSFWNKQPRRVSREAVIKANDELMKRASPFSGNCLFAYGREELEQRYPGITCSCPKCNTIC